MAIIICRLKRSRKKMKKRSIERFIEAQEGVYERALSELKEGCKRTHWMWYIFPQLEILGQSLKVSQTRIIRT